MNVNIPISIGELLDKISILEIKQEKIKSAEKLKLINIELDLLLAEKSKLINFPDNLYKKLKEINETLWQIEDDIREKEAKKEFDEDFVALARNVYFTNDTRGEVKKEINKHYNCEIQEVKEYKNYE